LLLSPIVFTGAVWVVSFDDLRILALPFIGVFAVVLGGALAYGFARAQRLTRRQTGSYIVSGGFTNIGSIGGLICYVLLGEAAFAMVPLHKFFEEFIYLTVGFPLAKSFSIEPGKNKNLAGRIRQAIIDPFAFISAVGIGAGIALNLTRVPRPQFYARINAILIPGMSVLILFSIGMALRFGSLRRYLRSSAWMALIKHALVPAAVTGVACALGFGTILDGLPLKVVLVLSFMPMGFFGMIPPTIYDLDLELANSNWLLTNALLLVVVPALYLLLRLL